MKAASSRLKNSYPAACWAAAGVAGAGAAGAISMGVIAVVAPAAAAPPTTAPLMKSRRSSSGFFIVSSPCHQSQPDPGEHAFFGTMLLLVEPGKARFWTIPIIDIIVCAMQETAAIGPGRTGS